MNIPSLQAVRDALKPYIADLICFRKAIHAAPEIGFETAGTLAAIRAFLASFGITGLDTETVPGSGLLVIEGTKPGPTIALRADIDALPIREQTGLSWASENGAMHACGHDGHQTWLIATMLYLASHRDFAGRVLCIFQAAEESVSGAQSVVESGVFERLNVREIYGAHNEPLLPAGTFAFQAGPVMASADRFEILVHGVGTHGARPNLGKDPLPAAAEIFIGLQTLVSRTLDPLKAAVVSVCGLNAGNAQTYNIVPDRVQLVGTVRTFHESIRNQIETEITARAQGIAAAFGLRAEVMYQRLVDAVDNYPALVLEAERLAREAFGSEHVVKLDEPYMISEDFSAYQQVAAGCFFFIGVRDSEHQAALHSPFYDFNDRVIEEAASFFSLLALKRLSALTEES